MGYDVLHVPDHLGAPAPFPTLATAAAVTEKLHLGTFVLNAGFYKPALLARDVMAMHDLTGGRLGPRPWHRLRRGGVQGRRDPVSERAGAGRPPAPRRGVHR